MTVRCDLLVRGASELVTMVPGAGAAAPAGAVDLGVIPRGAVACAGRPHRLGRPGGGYRRRRRGAG